MITSSEQINIAHYSRISLLNQEQLGAWIINQLESIGYVVIKDFPYDLQDLCSTGDRFKQVCELAGLPISHDANNSIIWDIKSNPNSKSFIKTYSEHSHEAELHTDSQYSFYPEDYFGLLTLVKADCGGGESMLLSLKDIIEELSFLPNGQSIINTLSNTDYPFVVPNVFKKNKGEDREYNFGPILRENEIRFRVDTMEKAVEARPDLLTEDQLEAYYALKELILNTEKTQRFHLEPGDLIFINNKTMLHGRTGFEDHKRHLLRIRMNKHGVELNQV